MKKTSAYAPLTIHVMVSERTSTADSLSIVATIGVSDDAPECHQNNYPKRTRIGALHLEGLQVNTWIDRTGHVYGGTLCYRDLYSVDLRKADAMASTLRAFKRALSKVSEEEGTSPGFVDDVLRVARAVNVEKIAIHRAVFGAARVAWGDGNEWQILSVASGIDTLRRLVEEIAAKRAA